MDFVAAGIKQSHKQRWLRHLLLAYALMCRLSIVRCFKYILFYFLLLGAWPGASFATPVPVHSRMTVADSMPEFLGLLDVAAINYSVWQYLRLVDHSSRFLQHPADLSPAIKTDQPTGFEQLKRDSLRIENKVLRPLWQTWWAYMVYAALVLGLIYWFIRIHRMRLLLEIEKLEQERIVVKRLTQIDKLKDEFLANTSHELRTPLNGIIGLAESLRDGVAGDVSPNMKYHLSLIIDSGKRLGSLVNDILDFAQLKNKGLTLNRKPVDVSVLVEIVLTLSKPLAEEKPIIFINNVPKNISAVFADEDRVLQILHNLIGNAVKFTERGVITIAASVTDDRVQVAVQDTGVGIATNYIPDIFESFTQLEGGVSRAQGGTGLGLSVTRQLVELHGGQLWVESTPDIGSTFYFTLPVSHEQPEQESKLATAVSDVIDRHLYEIDDISSDQQNRECILIVDDDSINRKVIANFLALRDYQIIEADGAEDAIKLIESGAEIDLVLLDIMMPRVSGYQACKILREHYPAHELPIILLTARSQMNDLVMGFEAGANDFLIKPIAKEELLARVATHLQLHDAHRNLDKKVAERTEELHKSNAVLKQAQEELQAAYQKLEEASLADPLTGLHNRRFLNKAMVADIAIVDRNYNDWLLISSRGTLPTAYPEQDFVFMLLDIDYFKMVNDTYGHGAGDKFLEQLSRLLETILRESDYLVRWGGEEFLIIVRYCVREEVPELAERIRQAVLQNEFDVGNAQKIYKTCSIGMAAYPFYRSAPTTLTWEQVIDTADRALYLAKNNGRNCWVNVESSGSSEGERVNPAMSDSLISLAAAGVITLNYSSEY